MDRTNTPVGSLETLLSIVDYLEESGEAGVTELAEAVDVSKSTVHNHLTTLREHGYVVRDDGKYRLGLSFLRIGEAARMETDLYDIARPHVETLIDGTDLVANLAVEEQGRGVYLYRTRGSNDIQFSTRAGDTHDLHCSATGKAILAHLPPDRRATLLDSIDLVEHTAQTITDRDTLRDELEQIRDRGVAFDKEEYGPGLRCVGVPILGPEDAVVGAVSLSGPAADMDGSWYHETLPQRLKSTKNRIEVNLRDY